VKERPEKKMKMKNVTRGKKNAVNPVNASAAVAVLVLLCTLGGSGVLEAQSVVPCSASNCWNVYGTVQYTVPTLAGPTDAVIVQQDGNAGQVRVECPNSTTTGCADLVPSQWVIIKGGIYGAAGLCVDGPNNQVQAVDVWRWVNGSQGWHWEFYDKTLQQWVSWP
jgi:hypothetical protein